MQEYHLIYYFAIVKNCGQWQPEHRTNRQAPQRCFQETQRHATCSHRYTSGGSGVTDKWALFFSRIRKLWASLPFDSFLYSKKYFIFVHYFINQKAKKLFLTHQTYLFNLMPLVTTENEEQIPGPCHGPTQHPPPTWVLLPWILLHLSWIPKGGAGTVCILLFIIQPCTAQGTSSSCVNTA